MANRHCGDCAWLGKHKDKRGLHTGALVCEGAAVNENLVVTYWGDANNCSGFLDKRNDKGELKDAG